MGGWFTRWSLRARLMAAGIALTALPLLVMAGLLWQQNRAAEGLARQGCTELATADLDHVAEQIVTMCAAEDEALKRQVSGALRVAEDVIARQGGASLAADQTVRWMTTNQVTQASSEVALPRMMIGATWLGQVTDAKTAVPAVDDVRKLVGGTCTVFQRMNAAGDMLRVGTNVLRKDGSRAIGTYIPAVDAEGKANPVVAAVMAGQPYVGRAFVVDGWYATAYQPIRDGKGEVVGMLYCGMPEAEATVALRKGLMSLKIGKTGYVYVVNAAGSTRGHYVISKEGKRDGENIWQSRDANGNYFIQEICKTAAALGPGQVGAARYPWKNEGDAAPRMKYVRVAYYRPWDWAIGVGTFEEEFQQTANSLAAAGQKSLWLQLGFAGLCMLGSAGAWFVASGRLGRALSQLAAMLGDGSNQVASAAGQVAGASQSLAQGASEQAAALEETTSALEEMASMTKKNAETAQQAAVLSSETQKSAAKGNQAMEKMSGAINDIQKSASETAKIIKVIDEIAFQTNLLALNAAVEAARAGEAGKGFAVVAEEVRNLAMRSAEAAKNTASMIEESVTNAKNGVTIAVEVGKQLDGISTAVTKVNSLVAEIAAASKEQSQGIEQVNTAVSQMDKVTQANAASAEESASAAEELSSQAEQVLGIVHELNAMVSGVRRQAPAAQRPVGEGKKQAAPEKAKPAAPRAAAAPAKEDFAEFSAVR